MIAATFRACLELEAPLPKKEKEHGQSVLLFKCVVCVRFLA
jgi:hypothetical protein